MTLSADHLFGRKLLQWNKEVQKNIQVSNVRIAKAGSKISVDYRSLMENVSHKYSLMLQLRKQLSYIPKLEQEIASMSKSIHEIEDRMEILNKIYCNSLAESHNSKMSFEENSHKFCLVEEKAKYQRKKQQLIEKLIKEHKMKKSEEIERRKQQNISKNESNSNANGSSVEEKISMKIVIDSKETAIVSESQSKSESKSEIR